jgi:hypothetical protein
MKHLVLAAILAITATAAHAEQWQMFEEEGVSLEYRNAADTASLMSVACSARLSEIFVPLDPGTKPPAPNPVLVTKEGGATKPIKLDVHVCGGDMTCSDRPDGDVSTYVTTGKGKTLALHFADKVTSAAIDAPGAKISATSDPAVFKRFAAACRKQK